MKIAFSVSAVLIFLCLGTGKELMAQNVFRDSFEVRHNTCPDLRSRKSQSNCIVTAIRVREVILHANGEFELEVEQASTVVYRASGEYEKGEHEIEFAFDRTWSTEIGYKYVNHRERIKLEAGNLMLDDKNPWFTGP